MIACGVSLIHFSSNLRNCSRGWGTRSEGEDAQTEAQTGASGTKWGRRSLHTLTSAAAVLAPTDGLGLEPLANVSAVWAH